MWSKWVKPSILSCSNKHSGADCTATLGGLTPYKEKEASFASEVFTTCVCDKNMSIGIYVIYSCLTYWIWSTCSDLLFCLERSKEASYQWSSWSHWPQPFSNSYCFHPPAFAVIVSSFWGLRLGNGKRESNTDTLCSLCCYIYVHLLVLYIDSGLL